MAADAVVEAALVLRAFYRGEYSRAKEGLQEQRFYSVWDVRVWQEEESVFAFLFEWPDGK